MKPHDEWLLKAEHDLKAAKLLKTDNELFDTAIYHTQQGSDKSHFVIRKDFYLYKG